jgi:hypothetical protein
MTSDSRPGPAASRTAALLLLLLLVVACVGSVPPREQPAASGMAAAAAEFLAGLDAAQRSRASLAFHAPERRDWNIVPRERPGVAIGELAPPDRARLQALVQAAFSEAGRARFAGVLELEALLRELQSTPGRPATFRDPGNYAIAIFGQPGAGRWGWRLEGHHWSTHFTSMDGGEWAVTPNFLGANPARVADGPHAGFALLGDEEDAARELVASLPAALRERASLGEATPGDVLWGPRVSGRDGEPRGITAAELDGAQRALLERIVARTFDDLALTLAASERARFEALPPQSVHFAFAGGEGEGSPWYWRVQAGDFAIEFAHPGGDRNHVHRLWRDLRRDFGGDPLREHLAQDH